MRFQKIIFQTDAESFSLKNKKALIQIKSFIGYCQYHNKKALFTDPVFSEGFAGDLAHFDDTLL